MRHLPAQLLTLAALEPGQHALDHAADLDRVEGLDDVADAADLLAELPVLEPDPRRQENDRDIAGRLVSGQTAGDLPAVDARHHHVEQDQVWPLLARELDPVRSVLRLEHFHARRGEVDAAEHPDRAFVVDHEHAARGARLGRAAPALLGLGCGTAAPGTPVPACSYAACRSQAKWLGDLSSH